jgi:TetR/AcrR family transcriptional repressor of nem operon
MIQTRGYNAVSFRDLAEAVEIKSASIHYYFPTKEEMAVALVQRYRQRFSGARQEIDATGAGPVERMERFNATLRKAFRQSGRMCLCGVLAAESSSVPAAVSTEVREFFRENEEWLMAVLAEGRGAGAFKFDGSAREAARSIFAALEGAMMSAWTFSNEERLSAAMRFIVRSISVS